MDTTAARTRNQRSPGEGSDPNRGGAGNPPHRDRPPLYRRGSDLRQAALHLSHWRADARCRSHLGEVELMERTHQDGLRSQLQQLLWRIRDRELSEPGFYRTMGIDLDVETIL